MQYRLTGLADQSRQHIVRRMIETWLKTLLGYSLMGVLIWGALLFAGSSYHFQLGFGLLWLFLPVPMWWFSAKISLAMSKAVPADPNNPEHARLIRLVHETWLLSGLKFEPPVYVADNPLPNAFATGPIHRKAVVAATKGLFLIGANDDEIKAVFAHELSHVRNYDVAINSFMSVLSSFFFLVMNAGVNAWIKTIGIFRKSIGLRERKAGERPRFAILGSIVAYLVFWLCGQLTKVVQMFVVRSRESGADATGAFMTKNPCALATALEKLVKYLEDHRPQGQQKEFWRAIRPMMTVDPLYDTLAAAPKPVTIWQKIKGLWQDLMLTHPPVEERVAQLERMNGGACPRI